MRYLFLLLILSQSALSAPVMYAHYINVGQADATLLEFPCGTVLIDVGSQDDVASQNLISYLDNYFSERPGFNKSIDAIIITHNHIDHTRSLKEIVNTFSVKNYIDNGQLGGTGTGDPRWVKNNATNGGRNINLVEISDSEITQISDKSGLTNSHIDPISCDTVDPIIRILSGRLDENPGWSHHEYDNKNNHSLVIRVDFGEASFLFTGDLEEDAIYTLLDWYSDTTILDVDIYQVGHHGSHNATTVELLEAMTPEIAVISMGEWNYGQSTNKKFSTWSYGHPRKIVVDMLTLSIDRKRSQSKNIKVAEGIKNFRDYTVTKAIYGTGWDGTVRIRATTEGEYRVTLH